jgi:hypothetical protein
LGTQLLFGPAAVWHAHCRSRWCGCPVANPFPPSVPLPPVAACSWPSSSRTRPRMRQPRRSGGRQQRPRQLMQHAPRRWRSQTARSTAERWMGACCRRSSRVRAMLCLLHLLRLLWLAVPSCACGGQHPAACWRGVGFSLHAPQTARCPQPNPSLLPAACCLQVCAVPSLMCLLTRWSRSSRRTQVGGHAALGFGDLCLRAAPRLLVFVHATVSCSPAIPFSPIPSPCAFLRSSPDCSLTVPRLSLPDWFLLPLARHLQTHCSALCTPAPWESPRRPCSCSSSS